MKKPNWNPSLYAASLILALAVLTASDARAALVSQNVREDAITPEPNGDTEEVVIVKKRPQAAPLAAPAAAPQSAPSQAVATAQVTLPAPAAAPAAPAKASIGNALDQSMQNKMDDAKNQFENALLKTMDRIKITVEDVGPAAAAQAAAPAPAAPTVVQDNLAAKQAAPAYLSVDSAPEMAEDSAVEGESVAAAEEETPKTTRVSVAPVFGKTMINSNLYNVDSRYTAGFEIEMALDDTFAVMLGYAYSQYYIGMGANNPFYGYYSGSLLNGNMAQLQYNQNLFSTGMRAYLMPKESKFRVFGGAGVGYNMGYVNYNMNVLNQYGSNPYNSNWGTPDYEVKSWLGLLEAGGLFNISKSVSLGALFRYALVFSSNQNQPLNNYAFVNSGYGYTPVSNQSIVGGSLARDSFYSILGTVKVSF